MKTMRSGGVLIVSILFLTLAVSSSLAQPVFGPRELGSALAVQKRYTENLLRVPGVVGTAVGVRQNGQPVIKVYAERDGLAGLPGLLDGVPITVEVTGKIMPLHHRPGHSAGSGGGGEASVDPSSKFPLPVPLGASSGNAESIEIVGLFITCSGGTLGGRLRSNSSYYALSNNHVYALTNDETTIGGMIVQPGPHHTSCNANDSNNIGRLSTFVPILFDGTPNTVDAAIASTTPAQVSKIYWDGNPQGSSIQAAQVNVPVRKYGATSGLTRGRVVAINASFNVDYGPDPETGDPRIARFENQIEFSGCKGACIKSGDSGSMLITDDGSYNPVGLLFAGTQSGRSAWANPAADVVNQLGGLQFD